MSGNRPVKQMYLRRAAGDGLRCFAAAACVCIGVVLVAVPATHAGPREDADRDVQAGMQLLQKPSLESVAAARARFNATLGRTPDHEGAHLGLVYAGLLAHYLRLPAGDRDALLEAVSHADAVLAANPASEDAWYKKSQALYFLDETGKSVETLRAGVQRLPASRALREGLVVLLLRAGREEEALTASRETSSGTAIDADLQLSLGRVWLDADRPAQAREHFLSAGAAKPSREATLGLAAALGAQAAYGDAIRTLESWLAGHPDDAEALRDLGLRCEEAGDRVKARIAWTRLRAAAADPKLRELADKHLERLKKPPVQKFAPNTSG